MLLLELVDAVLAELLVLGELRELLRLLLKLLVDNETSELDD